MILDINYLPSESRWEVTGKGAPSSCMTDYFAAAPIMHPEVRREILSPGEWMDSMMVSSLVLEGVDELVLSHINGGGEFKAVIHGPTKH